MESVTIVSMTEEMLNGSVADQTELTVSKNYKQVIDAKSDEK